MKKLPVLFFCFIVICTSVKAQTITPRRIRFTPIGKDSINLSYNSDYYLIEDTCAAIVRYTHFNFKEHRSFGKFKDISKQQPDLVLAEGSYTTDGHKDGEFISRYANGNLQAKGAFKNNVYDGHWELNYEDGKPRLTFEANNGVIKITDAWDAKGKKIVTNGNGSYTSGENVTSWSGKLLNGLPDGKWKAANPNNPDQPDLLTEHFEKGQFKGGKGPLGEYIDASRIFYFAPEVALPFTKAEVMMIAMNGCNTPTASNGGRVVNARYRFGTESFTDEIKNAVTGYLSKVDLRAYNKNLVFTGVIDKKGAIKNLRYDGPVNDDISRHMAFELGRLPVLIPATVNNNPVAQNFSITFTFEQGYYRFSYRFLSVIKD